MKTEEIKLAFETNQKIEFSLYNEIASLIKESNDDIDKMKQQARVAQSYFDSYMKNTKEAISLLQKAMALEKELGASNGPSEAKLKQLQNDKAGISYYEALKQLQK